MFSFFDAYHRGMATIFMLHRVEEKRPDGLVPNESLKVSPLVLDSFLKQAREKKYAFIHLDELIEALRRRQKLNKCLVFTLDDGYKDNIETALPIFSQHNCPFTIYVTSSFPDKTALLWWYWLEDYILQNRSVKIADEVVLNCHSLENKIRAFMHIRSLILQYDSKDIEGFLKRSLSLQICDLKSYVERLALSWEEVEQLQRHHLCTIGAHTRGHPSLKALDIEQARAEIRFGRQDLEAKLGMGSVRHFAYPFGTRNEVGEREFQVAAQEGFASSVTTRFGNIFLEHRNFLHCLPRIPFDDDFRLDKLWLRLFRINKFRRITTA